jgi:hypothetical protein
MQVELIVAICSGASATATGIFWGAYFMGQFSSRLKTVEVRLEDHDEAIRDLKRA